MRFRYFVIALAIACSLIAWRWAAAQSMAVVPIPPRVMAGGDIGFRVVGLRGDTAVGQLVVRVNGNWVEADIGAVNIRPLPAR
jgi:hypothetical protein